MVVRNLFARCGISSCLVSTAAVGQRFVDRERSVFYVKKKWKIVTTRPMLIEVMAPSVLGVSNLKTASFLSSQASRKLSCAVKRVLVVLLTERQLICQCQTTCRTFSAACARFRISWAMHVLCASSQVQFTIIWVTSGAAAAVYVEPVCGRQS